MSDTTPRLKKDGTPDPRYGPRKPKVVPVSTTGTDDLGQTVIPGVVVAKEPATNAHQALLEAQAELAALRAKGQDSLGQKIIPGSLVENAINYIEPDRSLTSSPNIPNAAGDTSMIAAPVIPYVARTEPGVRIIHFMEDGLTAIGKSWYRGEELVVLEGSPTWEETCGRDGKSFLDMTEDEQYDKWGKLIFRNGPWRGKGYDSVEFPEGVASDPEELKKLEKKRQRMQGAPLQPASS